MEHRSGTGGRRRIEVEICINSAGCAAVREAVSAAYEGGAARVELCRAIELEGLTPSPEHIRAARVAFRDRRGLVVMIRPRAGSFNYTPDELALMEEQIGLAAEAGADGVALGALRQNRWLAWSAMQRLIDAARRHRLKVTFHRAIDAVPDPVRAVEDLVHLGVDRVLTSGVPWGQKGGALEGAGHIGRMIRKAGGRLEIVIGGGINPENAHRLLQAVPIGDGAVSVHAYSGAQQTGRTTAEAVRALVRAVDLREVT